MRNRLLFTAALFCVEMSPFGSVFAPAHAADLANSTYNGLKAGNDLPQLLSDYNDPVIESAYNANAPYYEAKRDASGALVYDAKGNLEYSTTPPTDDQATQILKTITNAISSAGNTRCNALSSGCLTDDPTKVVGNMAADKLTQAVSFQQVFSTPPLFGVISNKLSGTRDLNFGPYALLVDNGSPDDVFSGSFTGAGLIVDSGIVNDATTPDGYIASSRSDVVTLTGQNAYDGYTIIRGTGVLVLADGGSLTTHGEVNVGQAATSSATMIVDRHSNLTVTAGGSEFAQGSPIIQSTSGTGLLVVGNGDANFDRSDEEESNDRLIIENGGHVTADTVAVTNYSGGSGILAVTGTDGSGVDSSYDAISDPHRSRLDVGYGGITVNAGTGALFIAAGGVVKDNGIISLGDAGNSVTGPTQPCAKTNSCDTDTVKAALAIAQGGTLIVSDAIPHMVGLGITLKALGASAEDINQNYGQLPSYYLDSNNNYVPLFPVSSKTNNIPLSEYRYLAVDGISANFGVAGDYVNNVLDKGLGSTTPSSGSLNYKVYMVDSTLENNWQQEVIQPVLTKDANGNSVVETDANGQPVLTETPSWAPLHTSANIGIAGTATFETIDDPDQKGAWDSRLIIDRIAQGLAPNTLPTQLDQAGITISGDISDISSSSTSSSTSVSGGVRVAGGGTLVLLGRNSYTGSTLITGGSTLQLGGFVDVVEPASSQSVPGYQNDLSSGSNAQGASTPCYATDTCNYSIYSQYEARIADQRVTSANAAETFFGNTGDLANSGAINQNSTVVLASDKTDGVVTSTGLSTLNLAWSTANSLWRNVGNTIYGDGQILRDVKGELDAPKAAAAISKTFGLSYINLSGNIALTDASNGAKPSVYVQNGYLSVGPQLDTDSSGQLTSSGQKGGISSSVGDGQKGNLWTNGTILIGNDGSDTGLAGQNFNLKTLATSEDAAKAAVANIQQNEQDLTSNPQFSIRYGGNVYANQVIMEGAFGGTLYNGSQDSTVPGGTLTVGPGGFRIGNNFSSITSKYDFMSYKVDDKNQVTWSDNTQPVSFFVHVSQGGVIQNYGVVTLGYQGELDVGDASDSGNQDKGTFIAGDVGTQAGITALSLTGDSIKDPRVKVWYNGIVQNRAGSDLHIDSDVHVANAQGSQYPTFDTNGQNMYLTGRVMNVDTNTGAMEKTGAGTLFMSNNASSYTGQTLVNEGKLTLTGAGNITSSSGVTVESGAVFNGNTYTNGVDGQTQTGAAAQTTVNAGAVLEVSDNQSDTSQASIGEAGINNTAVFNIGASGSTAQNLTMQNSGTTHSVLSVGGDSTANKNSALQSVALNVTGYDRAGGTVATTGTAINGTFTFLNSGVVNVQGSADIGSAIINFQRNDAGHLRDGDAYRILTTTTGLTHSAGNDNALTGGLTSLPYLSPYLVYEANALDILLKRSSSTFDGPCRTRNECEAGRTAGGLPVNGAIATALTGLNTAEEARRALNSLSGEIHASARTALIEDSALLEQAVLDRLDESGCDGEDSLPSHGHYDLNTHRKDGRCYADHAVLWGQAYGSMGRNYSDGNAGSLHHQSTGFIMGVDTPLDERWRVGGMVAYGRSMFNTSGAANASGNSNNISIGTYLGSHWGRLNLRLGGFYSWNLLNTRREVQVADVGGRQTSFYRDGTARIFGELGYKMRFKKTAFEPFVGMSYVNQYAGSFRERGVAGLSGHAEDMGVIYSSAGFRMARSFEIGKTQFHAHAMAVYRHAFGGIVSSRREAFIGGNGDMSIGGVPLSRDTAVVKAGVTAKLTDHIDVDLSYIGQYGSASMDNGATGSVRFAF